MSTTTRHIKDVVERTVAAIARRGKRGDGLTNLRKFKAILAGNATLKPEHELPARDTPEYIALVECFDYPETPMHKRKVVQNAAIESLITDVILEGAVLTDAVIIGAIKAGDIPAELRKIRRMAT